MKYAHTGITRIQRFPGFWVKRDDEAYFAGPEYPSGAKWRQYLKMLERQPGPLVVGCSATSAMQVYVAAAGKVTGRRAVVFTPSRKALTDEQYYAEGCGAEMNYIPHGYLSVVRKRMRDFAKGLPAHVHWEGNRAVYDVIYQCENIPAMAERVVVPVGSGLICAGIIAGLASTGRTLPVLGIAVSDMASRETILAKAMQATPLLSKAIYSWNLEVVKAAGPYDKPMWGGLPDGTRLDPYYASKALPFVRDGDLFWLPGIRPKIR